MLIDKKKWISLGILQMSKSIVEKAERINVQITNIDEDLLNIIFSQRVPLPQWNVHVTPSIIDYGRKFCELLYLWIKKQLLESIFQNCFFGGFFQIPSQ